MKICTQTSRAGDSGDGISMWAWLGPLIGILALGLLAGTGAAAFFVVRSRWEIDTNVIGSGIHRSVRSAGKENRRGATTLLTWRGDQVDFLHSCCRLFFPSKVKSSLRHLFSRYSFLIYIFCRGDPPTAPAAAAPPEPRTPDLTEETEEGEN